MLKNFRMDDSKLVCTLMVTSCKLSKDDESPKFDQRNYRSMICGLLYLTTTRPNITHVIFLVARFQEDPKETHVAAIKKILDI